MNIFGWLKRRLNEPLFGGETTREVHRQLFDPRTHPQDRPPVRDDPPATGPRPFFRLEVLSRAERRRFEDISSRYSVDFTVRWVEYAGGYGGYTDPAYRGEPTDEERRFMDQVLERLDRADPYEY